MPYVGLDLTQVQPWSGESEGLPPAENVVFRVTKTSQEQARNEKKTLQLVLELEVASEGELKGRKAFSRYTIDPAAKAGSLGRVRQLLDATEVRFDARGFADEELLGRYFVADSVHENYFQPDPVTGQNVPRTSQKIVNERHVRVLQAGGNVTPPAPVAGAVAAPQFAPAQAPQAPQAAPQFAPAQAPQAAPQYAQVPQVPAAFAAAPAPGAYVPPGAPAGYPVPAPAR